MHYSVRVRTFKIELRFLFDRVEREREVSSSKQVYNCDSVSVRNQHKRSLSGS